jgi:hypothetical protein
MGAHVPRPWRWTFAMSMWWIRFPLSPQKDYHLFGSLIFLSYICIMKYFDKEYKIEVEVVETTETSVRIFHTKKTKKGIDCYQWYNLDGREFKERFKTIEDVN